MLERDNKNDNAMNTPDQDGKLTKTKTSRGATTTRKKKTSTTTSKKKASYKIVSGSSKTSGTKKKTTRKTSSARSTAKFASAAPAPTVPEAGLGARAALRESARPRMVSAEERQQMIAKAAYHLATQRGFHTSDPRQNWIDAEAEVDSMLAEERGAPAE